jgi:malate synthase
MLDKAIRKAVIDVNILGETSKRTPEQDEALREAKDLVRENLEEAFLHVCASEISAIRAELCDAEQSNSFGYYDSVLMDAGTKVPTFPIQVNPQTVTPVLQQIYKAQTTVNGVLEEIEPVYNRWMSYEKRMKEMLKALCAFSTEWRGDALYQTLIPSDVWRRIKTLGEYVESFKRRLDALNKAAELTSRMITLHIEAPTGEMSREGSPAPSTGSGLTGGRPTRSWGQNRVEK